MGSIISVNSLEQNVGVSSVVLTLSEKINFLTRKSVCIVEADYKNPSLSYLFEGELIRSKCIDNLVPFIKDTEIIDNEFEEVLNINTIKFKNTNIEMLYGNKRDSKISDTQFKSLIYSLSQKYDIVVIDFGDSVIPTPIKDMSDINIFVVQPNNRYLNKLRKNKIDYLYRKTKVIINNSTAGSKHIIYELKDIIGPIQVIAKLPVSSSLVNNLSRAVINIDSGNYSVEITKLALYIIKFFNFSIDSKNNLVKKFLNKFDYRDKEIYVEGNLEYKLAELLIEENLCTEEDINRCIDKLRELKKRR